MAVFRCVLGVVVGLIVGSVVMMGIHLASFLLYPLPEGVEFTDPESLRRVIPTLPVGAFVAASLAHGLGTLAGALVAVLVGRRWPIVLAGVIGVLFLLGGVKNLMDLECPGWTWALDLPVYPLGAGLGGFLGVSLMPRKDTVGVLESTTP
jgi:hypothetical protein